jgi:ABC-2 type transport system ATP-binding protein
VVLDTVGLTKRFGDRVAVDGVSFTIAEGETYGLLGPNGAGKTTTISMVCGLLRRDGGTVWVAGHDLDRQPTEVRRAIGYVPQDLALYPDLTARENLRFFGRLQSLGGRALTARTAEVLDLVGLADRADDRVSEFSGGMKRRLNIGVGLLHRPRLLVLDEPTVGVDPQSRNAILASVADLGGEGIGVLYTTHYMEEAERLCDRVGIIDQGRLRAEGTRRELVALIGGQDHLRLGVDGDPAPAAALLGQRSDVTVAVAADHAVELTLDDGPGRLPDVLDSLRRAGVRVTAVQISEPDLESVFLHLTGRALRD